MSTFNKTVVMAVSASAMTAVYAQQAEIPARGTIPFAAFDQDDNGTPPQEKDDLILFIQVPKPRTLAWR